MATHVPTSWPEGVDVLAIDLDVREGSDSDALAAMRRVVDLGHADHVFVKIDSTLRGPIRGLVNGALEVFGRQVAVVAPAFPEQGRTLRDGRLHVDGRPGASLHDVLLGTVHSQVVDAETPADLRRVAEAAQAHPEWLLVGSAGLARQLAPPYQPTSVAATGRGQILIVAGSPSAVTRTQLDSVADLREVVILATPPSDVRDAGEAAEALAQRVAEWAQRHTPRAVVLTGGATARAVSQRLGATSLHILGEIEPGIPIGTLEDGVWHGLTVVTKAGGFGTPETLLDAVNALGVSSHR